MSAARGSMQVLRTAGPDGSSAMEYAEPAMLVRTLAWGVRRRAKVPAIEQDDCTAGDTMCS